MVDRPQSEKLIELHVYVIPSTLWQDRLRSAVNQVIAETVSAGFIRILRDCSLTSLREIVVKQLGPDVIPKEFIFCKSVGRCLTQVRLNQENELKAHHFLPPNSYCPELFLLDLDTASRSTPSLKTAGKNIFGNNGNSSYDKSIYGHNDHDYYSTNINNHKEDQFGKHTKENDNNSYMNSLKDDYYQSTTALKGSVIGGINLNDYPNLTSEEIRMLKGMSESEIKQYLINNGHMRGDIIDSNQNGASMNDDYDNGLYEDCGPQRGFQSGQRGDIPTVNIIDSDFDDSHMTELEKYQHYVSLLEQYKNQRSETDYRKEDMIKRAKQLYTKTANQKNIARDMWKKKYFEEKKRSPPIEDHLNKQRSELDAIHRKILGIIEVFINEKKSSGANQSLLDLGKMRLEAKKVEYEIEEAQRSVDEAKLKLTCEIKMTHQARAEVVALRADLVQKKINLSMTRSQHLSNMGTQDIYRPARVSLIKPVK